MATKKFTATETLTGSNGKYWYLSNNFTFDKINTKAAEIPANATITGCDMSYSAKRVTGSGLASEGTFKIEFSNTSSVIKNAVQGALSAGALELYKDENFKCNTPYSSSISLYNYINKSTGKISYSGATNIRFLSDFMYWGGGNDWTVSVEIVWTYTEHSHSYTSKITKEATCTTEGEKTFTCSCGDSYTEEIAKTAHNSNTTIPAVAPTCTATGKTEGKKCSVCGTVTVAQTTVAAKGHTEVTIPAVAATCIATGLTAGKKCSVCNTVITAQQTTQALGHSYKSEAIAPTINNYQGCIRHTCIRNGCGYYYDSDFWIAKILADKLLPSGILIDTSEVKEVYIDKTKVWG